MGSNPTDSSLASQQAAKARSDRDLYDPRWFGQPPIEPVHLATQQQITELSERIEHCFAMVERMANRLSRIEALLDTADMRARQRGLDASAERMLRASGTGSGNV